MNEQTRPQPHKNPPKNAPQPSPSGAVKVNPKETAQDFGEVKPKTASNPQRSRPGSDDPMAQPAQQAMPRAESTAGKWDQQVGAAEHARCHPPQGRAAKS